MSVLAIIVAYKPDEAALKENMKSYVPWVDHVLLWRNSPLSESFPGVELCGDCTNQGIGKALDFALDYALKEGYDWLLTMDQDSLWEGFKDYKEFVLNREEDAIWGPCINGERKGILEDCPFLITSGMMARVLLLENLGGWRKDFLIDALDVDLVLRARSRNIATYRVGVGNLIQQFGRKRKLDAGFTIYDYSPERLYGIFRNHIITFRANPESASPVKRMFIRRWILSRIPRIVLGEKNRRKKLGAIFRGIRDGLTANPRPVVGVVTWFGTPNYGTNLQAYATVYALRMLGMSPYLLHRFEDPVSLHSVKENFNRMMGIRRFWKYAPDPLPIKTRRIKEFCRRELPAKRVVGPCSLKRLKKRTDLFLCGSDQLWNAYDHFRGFEFLSFATGCRKAAFATSIGTADIPLKHKAEMRRLLSSFGPISMREEAGVNAIRELTGRQDIQLAGDPTFLLDAKQWRSVASGVSVPQEPYLLSYILHDGNQDAIREIASAAGIKRIISIPAGENPNPVVGEVLKDTGIKEFLALISGASLVVTDSFHGLALSANLSREMLILKRFSDTEKASQNVRLYELASRLGLGDRFYDGHLPGPVSWDSVQSRIGELRESLWTLLRRTVS